MSIVRNGYVEFRRSHISLHDEIRVGRPFTAMTEEHVITVRRLNEENRCITYEDIWRLV